MKLPSSVAIRAIALTLTGVALALPSFSIAQTSMIVVSAGAATGVGLASAAQYQVLSDAQWADYENVITIAVLNETTKLAVNSGAPMSSASYNSIATAVRAQLDASAPMSPLFQRMDVASRLRYGIDSLMPLASSQQASSLFPQALFEIEKAKFMQLETVVDSSRQQPADLALFATTSGALEFIADQIQQASGLAQNDPQYRAAVNIVLSALTTFDSASSYAQIQGTYGSALPTLPAPNADGSYTLSEQDLVSQYQSIVGAVQVMVNSDLAALESSNSGAAERPFVSAKAARRLAAPQAAATGGGSDTCSVIACKVAQGAVTGLSKLVGFSDPHLGMQISTVGSATIQAGFAIDQLVTGAVTGFATFGPIGAIAGAAAGIFSSIFGGSSSSADTAVLQQIQILSQQIARLQQDLDAQFAQVDATLNTILTTLNQNFALIDYELGTLNGSAVQIKNSLLDIETQLNSMEYYNLAYQQAEEADTLMLSVNGCLNYAATHNGADIGQSQFDNCENTFFTWAQTNANDAIWAPIPPNFADSGVYGFFNDFSNSGVCPSGCPTPFAATVNYLSQFPLQNLGISPLSTATLPNPDEWTLGARTYLLMAHQWPQYASGLNVSYLNELIQIGTTLQQAAQNVNSSRPTDGPISPNPTLFNKLSMKYAAEIANLQNAAYKVDSDYETNLAAQIKDDPTKHGISLNLWAGGANQQTKWRPTIENVGFCEGGDSTFQTPSNPLTALPDIYAFSQGFLGYGEISMCISPVQWVNVTDYSDNPKYCDDRAQDKPPDAPYTRDFQGCHVGQIQATVTVSFNGTPVFAQTENSFDYLVEAYLPEGCDRDGCSPTGAPLYVIPPHYAFQFLWTVLNNNLLAAFDKPGGAPVPQTQLVASLASGIDSVIARYEQAIYGQIVLDFNSAGTGMQTEGQLLSGDKLLFQAYTNFGLSDSLQSDSVLHGLLYGSQAIYDGPRVQADFAGFSTAAVADTTDDKITDEANAMNGGLTGLNAEIDTVLAAVQTNQLPESLSQIDVTLEDLQAFANLQSAGNALTPCAFQLSPGFAMVGQAGGSGTITVQEPSDCSWTASTGTPWLTVTSNPSGTGNGAVSYSVSSDTVDLGRDAIVIIGDQVFHVMQSGTGGAASFQQMPGSLQQVSVGTDGSVWGINSADAIFFYNSQTQAWQMVPGSLSQIAVGANGYIWGLNSGGNIYRFDPTTQNWDWIPGNLSQITVGSDGDVWGINSGHGVYHFVWAAQGWEYVPTTLTQIAVGFDGTVWGLGSAGNSNGRDIYRFNVGTRLFEQVPGELSQIAVGADGDVWGLNAENSIYHFNTLVQNWEQIPGSLSQISVGSATNVWGLDSSGNVYTFNSQAQNWMQIAGTLKQISAGENGSVWGVDSANNIYRFIQPHQPTNAWHAVPGASLTQVAAGVDNNVWALDSTTAIYHYDPLIQNWENVPGSLSQIAVGFGGDVWGINSGGSIYRYNSGIQSWENVPGELSQIAVGANGDVWGINSGGNIYRFNNAAQGWEQIPGNLKQLSVGADGVVGGINSAQQIFTYNPNAGGWTQIPGALVQIAVGSSSSIWGLNAGGNIYQFNLQSQNWEQIPGNLSQIAVGFDGTVWGINSGSQIYRYEPQLQGWDYVPGSLNQITVGADAVVWGVDSAHGGYRFW